MCNWFNFKLENQALWFGWLPWWAIHLCDWFHKSVLLPLDMMSLEQQKGLESGGAGERGSMGRGGLWERGCERGRGREKILKSWRRLSACRTGRWLGFLLWELPSMGVTTALHCLSGVHPEVSCRFICPCCPRAVLYPICTSLSTDLITPLSFPKDLLSQKQQWPNRFR